MTGMTDSDIRIRIFSFITFCSITGESKDVVVPPFAESVNEGDVRWEKKAGDQVKEDEVLCEIETDKVYYMIHSSFVYLRMNLEVITLLYFFPRHRFQYHPLLLECSRLYTSKMVQLCRLEPNCVPSKLVPLVVQLQQKQKHQRMNQNQLKLLLHHLHQHQ